VSTQIAIQKSDFTEEPMRDREYNS
jgi:hypothetical protein